ncbi:hypothetical protein EMCG_04047 [[Emmonsia] crescens]|uniref:Uncharacterized protein n=1 Tax=[Emmonsia] crescens TaxID=73230 RepID=A0A0G2HUB7_9EURO|nr:hypothetical protein EMCG_04047 [Emmonsia crescens UAMH 3008]
MKGRKCEEVGMKKRFLTARRTEEEEEEEKKQRIGKRETGAVTIRVPGNVHPGPRCGDCLDMQSKPHWPPGPLAQAGQPVMYLDVSRAWKRYVYAAI